MSYTTTINYKGFVIVVENGKYWLAIEPKIKYGSMSVAKDRIDTLAFENDQTRIN